MKLTPLKLVKLSSSSAGTVEPVHASNWLQPASTRRMSALNHATL